MQTPAPPAAHRLAALERELATVTARIGRLEELVLGTAVPSALATGEPAVSVEPPRPSPSPAPAAATAAPSAPREPTPNSAVAGGRETSRPPAPRVVTSRPPASLEDLLGGRVLAWAGAVAVLLGVAFFVAIAIGRGWIDESTRISLSFLACTLLTLAGTWLHERRGRTQASLAAVGAGTAGLFLTLTAASQLYRLVSVPEGLIAALAIGAATTAIAVRWDSRVVGAVGVLGALLAPALVGAEIDSAGLAYLAVALTSAVGVLIWRRWEWLAVASFVVTAPQLLGWTPGDSVVEVLVVVGVFWALFAAAALGHDLRVGVAGLRASSSLLVSANALVVAAFGHASLGQVAGSTAGDWFLASLALTHIAIGTAVLTRRRELGLLLVATGVMVGNVAFGLLAGGPALATGWAASAVALAGLARRYPAEAELTRAGLGVQLSLSLLHILLFEASPTVLLDGGGELTGPMFAMLALAVSAFCCARLSSDDERVRIAFDVVALVTLAYASAWALSGAALVVAWAAQSMALMGTARRFDDGVARAGALGFLGLAAIHAIAIEAPVSALLDGVDDLGTATLALASLAAGCMVAASVETDETRRARGELIAGGVLVYLGSVAIVSALGGDPVFAGSPAERQDAQTLLSTFWALTGLGVLVAGLLGDHRERRLAGLALLVLAVCKVFLFDLAALDSIYRVLSFVGLGLLLLVGAYAYQRIRPVAR